MKSRVRILTQFDSEGTKQYLVRCVYCHSINKVYHMSWCGITCQTCRKMTPNPKHKCAGKTECHYEDSDSE